VAFAVPTHVIVACIAGDDVLDNALWRIDDRGCSRPKPSTSPDPPGGSRSAVEWQVTLWVVCYNAEQLRSSNRELGLG